MGVFRFVDTPTISFMYGKEIVIQWKSSEECRFLPWMPIGISFTAPAVRQPDFAQENTFHCARLIWYDAIVNADGDEVVCGNR